MKPILIALFHHVSGEGKRGQEMQLLKLANAWLQRKQAGELDHLLLIGVNFESDEVFRNYVVSYGLTEVDTATVTTEEGYEDALGEDVENIVSPWLSVKHPTAIGFLGWQKLIGDNLYSEIDWWWTGMKGTDDAEELSAVLDGIDELLPSDFRAAKSTWLELLLQETGHWIFDSEEANYNVSMEALGLARWLEGFDAASGNGFYDFDYSTASQTVGIEDIRLAAEAWRDCPEVVEDAYADENSTEDDLRVACLRACLSNRNSAIASSLSSAFQGDTALLWALHSSIWPKLNKPMGEAATELVSGEYGDFSEVMQQWQFVSEGWGDFVED